MCLVMMLLKRSPYTRRGALALTLGLCWAQLRPAVHCRSQAQTAPAQNFAADSLAEQEARDLESALAASAAEARRVQGSPRQQQQPQQQPGPTSQPRAQAQPEAQSFTVSI